MQILGSYNCCPGILKYSSISESKVELFDGKGVKTGARCGQKCMPFFRLIGPMILIGIIEVGYIIGLLIFLVAFQIV